MTHHETAELTESRKGKLKSRSEAVFVQYCPRMVHKPSGMTENVGEKGGACRDRECQVLPFNDSISTPHPS